jgi:hypothetical protein
LGFDVAHDTLHCVAARFIFIIVVGQIIERQFGVNEVPLTPALSPCVPRRVGTGMGRKG